MNLTFYVSIFNIVTTPINKTTTRQNKVIASGDNDDVDDSLKPRINNDKQISNKSISSRFSFFLFSLGLHE